MIDHEPPQPIEIVEDGIRVDQWLEENAPIDQWPEIRNALIDYLNDYGNSRPRGSMGAFEEANFHALSRVTDSDIPDVEKLREAWDALHF